MLLRACAPVLLRHVRLDLGERRRIAFGCGEQARGLDAGDRVELIAERVADPDRLAGEADHDAADHVVRVALVAAHAGRGADAVAHAVDAELRPALAPQVGGRLRAVDRREHVAQLLDARRDAAMRLADIDRLDLEIARHGAADMARLVEIDAEIVADDAADGAAPADDARDRLLVDGVLRRDDEAVGREVRADQRRRPFGVVGLAGDDRDVDRPLLSRATAPR